MNSFILLLLAILLTTTDLQIWIVFQNHWIEHRSHQHLNNGTTRHLVMTKVCMDRRHLRSDPRWPSFRSSPLEEYPRVVWRAPTGPRSPSSWRWTRGPADDISDQVTDSGASGLTPPHRLVVSGVEGVTLPIGTHQLTVNSVEKNPDGSRKSQICFRF